MMADGCKRRSPTAWNDLSELFPSIPERFPMHANRCRQFDQRRGFTLTELLVVIGMVVLLSSTALFALWGASEEAKARRTRTIISKVDLLVEERWESLRTRRVSINPAITANLNTGPKRAFARVAAIRELQRMEFPERKTDMTLSFSPFVLANTPARFRGYWRRCIKQLGETTAGSGIPDFSKWTVQFQGSECLYLILSGLSDGDKTGLDILRPEEMGDVDNDGMPEVLDAWRRPIDIIRWPAGYLANPELAWLQDDATLSIPPASCNAGPVVAAVTEQNAFYHGSLAPGATLSPAPDAFDPLRSDPRWRDTDDPSAGTAAEPEHGRVNNPYELRPLIFSAGADREKKVDAIVADSSGAVPDLAVHGSVSAELEALADTGNASSPYYGMHSNFFRNDPYRFFHISEDCGGTMVPLTFQLGTPRGPESLDNITNHNLEAQ